MRDATSSTSRCRRFDVTLRAENEDIVSPNLSIIMNTVDRGPRAPMDVKFQKNRNKKQEIRK